MYIETLGKRYNLVEFNSYGTYIGDKPSYVLELLLDCTVDDFDKNDFKGTIIISADQYHIFFCYELSEWYEEDGCVKVICVK